MLLYQAKLTVHSFIGLGTILFVQVQIKEKINRYNLFYNIDLFQNVFLSGYFTVKALTKPFIFTAVLL